MTTESCAIFLGGKAGPESSAVFGLPEGDMRAAWGFGIGSCKRLAATSNAPREGDNFVVSISGRGDRTGEEGAEPGFLGGWKNFPAGAVVFLGEAGALPLLSHLPVLLAISVVLATSDIAALFVANFRTTASLVGEAGHGEEREMAVSVFGGEAFCSCAPPETCCSNESMVKASSFEANASADREREGVPLWLDGAES